MSSPSDSNPDELSSRFAAAWSSGGQPRVEAFLESNSLPVDAERLRVLLPVEIRSRGEQGDAPTLEELRERFPDHPDIVALAAKELPSTKLNSTGLQASVEKTMSFARSDAKIANASHESPKQASMPRTIGRFRILALLGSGGFGRVYRAYDPQLDREVAIKAPKAGLLETEADVERFFREAKASASIQHRNICPVYETGVVDDQYFIVMAYVEGRTLGDLIAESDRLSPDQITRLLHKVAIAISAAHDAGVIHRDLKPANIMIDQEGEPVVMDFGLARRINAADAELTHSGQVLGTPAYMPPEQARGELERIDERSDVYSLGVVLYEMLSGSAPFRGPVADVLAKVLHEEPRLPSEIRKKVDSHLENVCLRAILKNPDDRFSSMKEMAAALAGELETIDITLPARRAKFRARLRRLSLYGAIGIFLSAAAVLIYYWRTDYGAMRIQVHEPNVQVTVDNNVITFKDGEQVLRLRRGLQTIVIEELDKNGKVIATQTKELKIERGVELNVHVATNSAGKIVVFTGEPLPTWLQTKIAAARGPPVSNPPVTSHGLTVAGPPTQVQRFSATAAVIDAELSRDERFVATTDNAEAALWEVGTGKLINRFGGHDEEIWCVAVSPDNKLVAVGSADKKIRLYDAMSGEELRELVGHQGKLGSLKFTDDSRKLVSWAFDRSMRVWNVANGSELRSIDVLTTAGRIYESDDSELSNDQEAKYTRPVQFSENAELALVATSDNRVEIWDLEEGEKRLEFARHEAPAIAVALSQEGNLAASASLDGSVLVWDPSDAKLICELGKFTPRVNSLCLSSDGRWLAASMLDRTIRVWEAATGKEVFRFGKTDEPGVAIRIEFTKDDRFVMTGANDQNVSFWRLPSESQLVQSASATSVPLAKGRGWGKSAASSGPAETRKIPTASPPGPPGLAIAPFDAAGAKTHQASWAEHLEVPVNWVNEKGLQFRLIPPGEFMMGSDAQEVAALKKNLVSQVYRRGTRPREGLIDLEQVGEEWTQLVDAQTPQHRSRITSPFYFGAHEVTRGQFLAFVESTGYRTETEWVNERDNQDLPTWRQPGCEQSDSHPVLYLTWRDAQAYVNWLSSHDPAYRYRLPTEAEWEFAARAGSSLRYCFGDDSRQLRQYAQLGGGSAPIKQLKANNFGLFDVHGNAYEWCGDWLDPTAYHERETAELSVDPFVILGSGSRVRRGGCFLNSEWCTHLALRYANTSTPAPSGIRVVAEIDSTKIPKPALDVSESVATFPESGVNNSVAFIEDGSRLVTANTNHYLQIWDLTDQRLVEELNTPTTLLDLAVSPSGYQIATAGMGRQCQLWNLRTASRQQNFRSEAPGASIPSVSFAPDGQSVAAVRVDGQALVWDVATGSERFRFRVTPPRNKTHCEIHYSVDGKQLYVAPFQKSGVVQVFDASNGDLINELKLGAAWGGSGRIALSPNGRRFALGSFTGACGLFQLDGTLVQRCSGTGDVSQVVFSPSGRYIAVGHFRGNVQLVDAVTMKPIQTYRHGGGIVQAVAFSPDERLLASSTREDRFHAKRGTAEVRIWRVPR